MKDTELENILDHSNAILDHSNLRVDPLAPLPLARGALLQLPAPLRRRPQLPPPARLSEAGQHVLRLQGAPLPPPARAAWHLV